MTIVISVAVIENIKNCTCFLFAEKDCKSCGTEKNFIKRVMSSYESFGETN